MASNGHLNTWRVKIANLPSAITIELLAQFLNVPSSRINIPKTQKNDTYFAWIHGFSDKKEADDFVKVNSGRIIDDLNMRCKVIEPENEKNPTSERQSVEIPMDRQSPILSPLMANHTNTSPVYKLRQRPDKNKENLQQQKSITEAGATIQHTDNEHERKLCPYANRGECRFKDGECKYRHTRCTDFDSCKKGDCQFAHKQGRLRPRSDSRASTPDCVLDRTKKRCRSGATCYKANCLFGHPEGWNACKDKSECVNYDCNSNHPPGRRAKCSHGKDCSNGKCKFLHPRKLVDEKVTKVIALSTAKHNFLQYSGDKMLDEIRKQPGIEVVNLEKDKLQLSGKNSSITSTESYLENNLLEQNITIKNHLWTYLQSCNSGCLWKAFIKKYHVGFSFLKIPSNTDTNKTTKTNRVEQEDADQDVDESDDEQIDDDDDVNDQSHPFNKPSRDIPTSAIPKNRRRCGPKLVQVTLCSDSEDSLSKAIKELKSFSMFTASWVLTEDEISFILKQSQKGKASRDTLPLREKVFRIKDYLISTVRSVKKCVVLVLVFHKSAVWRVTVTGFKQDVTKAVSKVKEHLNDNVESEVQIPISAVMAMFLRTKAASYLRKLEKDNTIKLNAFSANRRKGINDEDNDDVNCLKIIGSNSHIDSGRENVEKFLDSLSEQEKHFPQDDWDTSKAISQILITHLKKLQDSDDCEAVGLIKFYTAVERKNITTRVTLSIVGMNEEATDSVIEKCQDVVEGYVIWKPSSDEYNAITKVLFMKKTPSIQEFRQEWDTEIKLNRETSTITIPAKSKMIADDIKEALLGLGTEQKLRQTRTSIFIPIQPSIRRFVNQQINSILDKAKSQRVFIECKNANGLNVHGRSDFVNELKNSITAIIDGINQKLITRRVQLSSPESELMQTNQYEIPKRIERETNTKIRIVTIEKDSRLSNGKDNGTDSTVTTVVNVRGQTIVVKKGDITRAKKVDAIINAANGPLYHAGGVDKVISDAAGFALDQECKQLITKNGGLPFPAGKAVKTTAGNLPFKCVIHAIGPQYVDGNQQERALLFACVLSSLKLAEDEQCTNVAMPAISSNTYGFPVADCTTIVVRAVKQFFADYPQSKVKKVILQDTDDAVCNSFAREVVVDHRNSVVDDDDIMNYELPPLTAKWCWQDDDGEKINDDNHARQIEYAFQNYLNTATMPNLVLHADNLKSGTIVNYSIHFHPNLNQLLASNPNLIKDRLVCGHQKREDTGFKRNIIRYPVQQTIQSKRFVYSPKPLDAYSLQISTNNVDWDIIGMSITAVQRAQSSIQKAIETATISEPFSINLDKDLDDHKQELLKIAMQQKVEINFSQESTGQLSTVLIGLRQNVMETKLKLALYAQDILKMKIDQDDDLNVPKEWGDQQEGCKLVEIMRNDSCFARIESRVKETISNMKINKIERVQNLRMWSHYAMRRRQLKKELSAMPNIQIEMELFHGTRTTIPSEVYNGEYGFDMTFSSSGMWGIGTYFAKNASYSCGSYAYKLPDGQQQVFLAQVLTGDVYDCKSDSSLRRPPKKDEKQSGLRYNSVSGDTGGSKVYIVYENRVAYPTYLITFTV